MPLFIFSPLEKIPGSDHGCLLWIRCWHLYGLVFDICCGSVPEVCCGLKYSNKFCIHNRSIGFFRWIRWSRSTSLTVWWRHQWAGHEVSMVTAYDVINLDPIRRQDRSTPETRFKNWKRRGVKVCPILWRWKISLTKEFSLTYFCGFFKKNISE